MTLLIGTIIGSGSGAIANSFTGTRLVIRDYVASASGNLETISYLDDASDDNLIFVVYSSTNDYLGKTGEVTPANGAITGTLTTPIPIVTGNTYKLGVYCKSGYARYLSNGTSPAKVYDGASYSSPASTITPVDDGGVNQMQFWGSGTLSSAQSIDTVTTPLLLGSSGNSITTTNLGTLTSLTIGGKAVSSLSAPSGDGTFSIPSWIDGVQGFLLGSGQAIVAGDGTNTATSTATINPQSGYTLVTLTSVNTASSYLGNQVSLSVGDQIIFPTAASLGATTNYIDVDGGIYTDYAGAQTLYKRNTTTGIVTQITLINGLIAPSKFSLLWFFGM